jgi:hypothetical protein
LSVRIGDPPHSTPSWTTPRRLRPIVTGRTEHNEHQLTVPVSSPTARGAPAHD